MHTPASAVKLLENWGITIEPELLILSLTHRSFANENGGIPTNERLEFLGDAVLQLIVTDKLYATYPDHPEGHLAKMRSATVSQPALAMVAKKLNLGDYILLGRGENHTGGRQKDSILSDTFEALIGATYLSHGMEKTRRVVETQLDFLLKQALERGVGMDWKTTVQELCAALSLGEVSYQIDGSGPDHKRTYRAELMVGERIWGAGTASSKKLAEHYAAEKAILAIRKEHNLTGPIGFELGIGGK